MSRRAALKLKRRERPGVRAFASSRSLRLVVADRTSEKRCDGILDRVSLYAPIRPDEPKERWRDFVGAFRAA